mgnify:CR=1 FL=1
MAIRNLRAIRAKKSETQLFDFDDTWTAPFQPDDDLDDIFMIFVGRTKTLHKLLDEINKIHPSIKLTMSHTSLSSEKENVSLMCIHSIAAIKKKHH